MKGKQQQDFRVEKYIRYGIRKYSFGAASVAIAAGLMFLGNGAVSANEAAVNGNGSDVAVVSANTGDNQDKVVTPVVDNKEVKEKAKPEVATPAVTPKVEESKKEEATKEEAAPKLDKSQLESYVNEVAGKLAAGKYANKTDESLALLNADLEAAKTALSNATSQDELKVAYNKLVTTVNSKLKNKPVEKKETPAVDTTNGKETVGKKAENTEKKSESNAIENTGSKDERNGKELVEGSNLRSANEGYTLASTELRKKTVSLQQLLVKRIKNQIAMLHIEFMLKDSNLKTQRQQLETIHNLVLEHVLIFLYQKQKHKNLDVKQRCGIISFVQVVKIIILTHMDQVELMNIQQQKFMDTHMNKVTTMFI